jgi:raffinose/stachyose/melibiose transport system substrate-binding protein
MASTATRLGALGLLATLAVSACSGGFGGASPTTAPSTAATEAPSSAASDAPSPSEAAAEPVALTWYVDDNNVTQARLQGLIDAYTKLHPEVTIDIETHPGGTDGDNLVKTKLATGDMPDLFYYNSGSLLQALNPADTLVDLKDQPFVANLQESYLPTVSATNGAIVGVPTEGSLGGGILYNMNIYSDLGLSVPKTWAEFAANNEKIKQDGKAAPVCATFADTWTSQLFVLADYYNVQVADPTFAADYTANKAHYADTPAAQAGFAHLQEAFDKDWWQKDFGADKFEIGQQKLAEGKCAHYPMLTFAVGTIVENYPDMKDKIGFFGQPGDDAATNGSTIWMPAATYIPKTTTGAKLDAAKAFVNFIGTVDGCNAMTAGVAPSGPYVVKGCTLPDDVPQAIKDIQPYIDGGNNSPALEFLSPVKGPSLENITTAVGSGLQKADQAAKDYDADVEKQAKQLGLPGW